MRLGFLFAATLFLFSSSAQSATLPIVEVTSPSGLKAWLVEDHNLPLVTISLSFRGGVETDPYEKQGLATLTTSLLTQGAGPYDEEAFQEKLASNSIQMSFSAGRDFLLGQVKTLKRTRHEAFNLLRLALTEPRFDQTVVERLKAQQSTSARYQLSNPRWQGRYALYKAIYGPHPYAHRSLGSEKTIDAITVKDVKTFARTHLTREGLKIAVVGAISPKELAQSLDSVFEGLPKESKLDQAKPFVWPQNPKSILIERDGTQTNVIFASPMMMRSDPDWYAGRIANYILGGGSFTSRLMKELRGREGLTYGINTSLAGMQAASFFIGSFATDNAKAGQAVEVVQSVQQGFYKKGVTAAEVTAAQDYLIGSLALSLTSTDLVAGALLTMLNKGLGIDYLDQRNAYFKAVTREDVNRVIKKWFNPQTAFYAYVGMPNGLDPDKTEKPVTE